MNDRAGRVIRTPDQRVRVFVSSTLEELAEERATARDAIVRLRLAPILFELGARPHPPRDLYRAYLDQSHIFVGIYWERYGWIAPGEAFSGLEDEYRLSGDMPKLIYVKSPAADREGRLEELLDRIRADDQVSYKPFGSPAELRELLEADLMLLLTERFETPERSSADESLTVPSNLPVALNPFIGRQRELQELKHQLSHTRLLTLLGPGGTGKTRLAVHAATELLDDREGRVYFVDLTLCRDVESVVSSIARTIGVRETSDRPILDDLKSRIATHKMLLLLDNFEQVTVAGPMMVQLLRDCPGLTALVTSRAALHVTGEQVFMVPPLALPQQDGTHVPFEQLSRFEAIALFVERAQAVKQGFRLTTENAPSVVELCVRLDGLPLAIELATARLALFSPQALVERLGDRLKLLQGGARDVPVRQQTLRDTIAWSYEMLDVGEQRLFQLLSLFWGATFEAIESVAAGLSGLDGIDVLDAMSSLVDKSLVSQSESGDGLGRFTMLETIREFASDRLDEDGELCAAARRAHATHFATWTHRQWASLAGDGRDATSRELAADLANIQSAWRFWVAEGDFEQLAYMTDSLWLLYDVHGWYHATAALTTDLLHVLSATPSTPERVLEEITLQTSLARVLLALRGYTQEVEEAYTRALQLCGGQGEIPQLLPVLRGLASLYIYRAEFDKGAQLGEQILRLAERTGDEGTRVEGHLVLGANLAFLNQLEAGLDHLEQGLAAYDPDQYGTSRFQLGNNPGVVCRVTSALVRWMLGFPDRACEQANEAIDLSRKLNHPSSMAYALFHTGLIHLWRREDDLAHRCALAVLDIAAEHDFPIWVAVGGCLRGAALARMGDAGEGLTVLEEAISTYQRLSTPPVFWPLIRFLQAGACGMADRAGEGLALLDESIELTGQSQGKTLVSEFFRLKGDLLLVLSPSNTAEAERWFRAALDAAANARAPMLQLRAALGLGRLLREQGQREEARELLTTAYARLTEGFTTADLTDAKALLDDLG
jgi:predicted ATPase/tetratricopeptide (TPR) repeat protein